MPLARLPDHLPTPQADMGASGLASGAGDDVHIGHRGDAGQRLATKAEGGYGFQVVYVGYLAGGMAAEGQLHFIGRDAPAVVRNPYQGRSPTPGLHRDAAGAGIQRVLHQLLDHRSRPPHHLTGGDARYQLGIQDPDSHVRQRSRQCIMSNASRRGQSTFSRGAKLSSSFLTPAPSKATTTSASPSAWR